MAWADQVRSTNHTGSLWQGQLKTVWITQILLWLGYWSTWGRRLNKREHSEIEATVLSRSRHFDKSIISDYIAFLPFILLSCLPHGSVVSDFEDPCSQAFFSDPWTTPVYLGACSIQCTRACSAWQKQQIQSVKMFGNARWQSSIAQTQTY